MSHYALVTCAVPNGSGRGSHIPSSNFMSAFQLLISLDLEWGGGGSGRHQGKRFEELNIPLFNVSFYTNILVKGVAQKWKSHWQLKGFVSCYQINQANYCLSIPKGQHQ